MNWLIRGLTAALLFAAGPALAAKVTVISTDLIGAMPTHLNFVGQTNAFSITAWITTSSTSTTPECIVCKADNATGQYEFYLSGGSGTLGAAVGDQFSVGTKNLRDGQKHLVVVTVPAAGSGLLLYVDGAIEAFSSGNGAIGNTTTSKDVLIGARHDATNTDFLRVWTGSPDMDARIYDRVISAAEITAIFNGQQASLPPGSTPILLGLLQGDQTHFSTTMGRFPDFIGSWQTVGVGDGANPSVQDLGYPFVAVFNTVANGGDCMSAPFQDWAAAARGDYNGAYQSVANTNILGGPGRPYAIRINTEWAGNGVFGGSGWYCTSPWFYPANESDAICLAGQIPQVNYCRLPPAVFIAAIRNLIGVIKTTPGLENVKIECEAPQDDIQAIYWPGDDVCQLAGFDTYWDSNWDGVTPGGVTPADVQHSWDRRLPGITYQSAFARAHNKPMLIGEWCDTYPDGVNLTKFANWMKDPANNVVAQSYWDSEDGISAADGCSLWLRPARQAAYLAAFGGTSYQGTYWLPLLPLPSGNPMQY
jgi:hypothetical protein